MAWGHQDEKQVWKTNEKQVLNREAWGRWSFAQPNVSNSTQIYIWLSCTESLNSVRWPTTPSSCLSSIMVQLLFFLKLPSPQCPVNLLYTKLCPNIHVLFLHSSLYLSCKLFYISAFSSNHFDTTSHSEILWWVAILSKYLFYLKDNYITDVWWFWPYIKKTQP